MICLVHSSNPHRHEEGLADFDGKQHQNCNSPRKFTWFLCLFLFVIGLALTAVLVFAEGLAGLYRINLHLVGALIWGAGLWIMLAATRTRKR